jgi:probable phosphoglycerate mutase
MSKSAPRLYLVRHGESAWNVQRRIQSNLHENGLSEVGRKQAELLGRRLSALEFESVYCSDVQRAVETAEIALEDSSSVEYMEGLREISFGSWEGKLIAEIKREYPGEIERWFDKPTSVSIDGGEHLNDFGERVAGIMETIADRTGSGNALVITHGGVICSYLTQILGMSPDGLWSFSLPNASLTAVTLEFRPRLRLFGDTSHLDPGSIGFDGMPSVYDGT